MFTRPHLPRVFTNPYKNPCEISFHVSVRHRNVEVAAVPGCFQRKQEYRFPSSSDERGGVCNNGCNNESIQVHRQTHCRGEGVHAGVEEYGAQEAVYWASRYVCTALHNSSCSVKDAESGAPLLWKFPSASPPFLSPHALRRLSLLFILSFPFHVPFAAPPSSLLLLLLFPLALLSSRSRVSPQSPRHLSSHYRPSCSHCPLPCSFPFLSWRILNPSRWPRPSLCHALAPTALIYSGEYQPISIHCRRRLGAGQAIAFASGPRLRLAAQGKGLSRDVPALL